MLPSFAAIDQGDGEDSNVGGTYGVEIGWDVGVLSGAGVIVSVFGAVSMLTDGFVDFGFVRGFSSGVLLADFFGAFDFDVDVGTKWTVTGFG